MADEVTEIKQLLDSKPKTKKDKIHKNLQITFAIVGIITLGLSALVNIYTLKKIYK